MIARRWKPEQLRFSLKRILAAVALLGMSLLVLQMIPEVPASDKPFPIVLAISLICGSVGAVIGGWRGFLVGTIAAVLTILLLCGLGSILLNRIFVIPPQGILLIEAIEQ